MTRKQELVEIIKKTGDQNEIKAKRLIDEIIFIEEQLDQLKKLPFISVNPKAPTMQKVTPASKQYKELLQQYNNCLRLLFRIAGDFGEGEEESPLRTWAKKRKENEE